MIRSHIVAAFALLFCLTTVVTHGAQRGKAGGKEHGGKPPGGQWSERSHSGKPNHGQAGDHGQAGNHGEAGNKRGESQGFDNAAGRGNAAGAGNAKSKLSSGAGTNNKAAGGAAAANRKSTNATGAEGAAAGAAASNRKAPNATGAQGAAAGAAAANRNAPQATGAQGAAAGAAAANRNQPQVSGAQGAAAGAAAANRNQPQVSGAEGAVAGAAAANRNQPEFSGAAGAAAGYADVRNSFTHPNMYGAAWYGAHPGVWTAGGWAAGAAWAPSTWGAVSSFAGYGTAAPVSYNYGENVVAQDGNVLVNGESVGTTDEFSQQAADLAQSGTDAQTSDSEEWLPLGVFAMVRNEKQHAQLIVQLAINKQGILRGNFTDELTENTQNIHGAVDKKTQRAAWTVGDNKQTVMEAGLSDLTDGEAPALVHKNGKTDHWLLVRLDQPKSGADGSDPADGQK